MKRADQYAKTMQSERVYQVIYVNSVLCITEQPIGCAEFLLNVVKHELHLQLRKAIPDDLESLDRMGIRLAFSC